MRMRGERHSRQAPRSAARDFLRRGASPDIFARISNTSPRRAAAAPDPSPPVFYDDLNADEAEASSAQAKMTKAERKALRRRLEKMKRDRQRQA